MRVIRFLTARYEKTWVSPSRFFSAILGKEPLRFMDHTHHPAPKFELAILNAVTYIRQWLAAGAWQALFGLMLATAVAGLLKYPVIMGRLPSPIPEIVFLMVSVFVMISLVQLIRLLFTTAKFEFRYRKLKLPHIWRGPVLAPPPIAQRSVPIKRPKAGWAVALFIAVILLNSVVIATPYRPAIMSDGSVVETFKWVRMDEQWSMRHRYPAGLSVGYVFIQGKTIWWVQIDYDAEYLDITGDDIDFDTAMDNYLASITSNIYSFVAQDWGPDATDAARLASLQEWYEDPANVKALQTWFRTHFNTTFVDYMRMRNIEVSFQEGGIQEYIKWRDR